jgi:transposase
VIHPTSIAVSREHRRAKTDRLDLELLKRALLGWLRGEKKRRSIAAIPSLAEEDAQRLNRERQTVTHEASRILNRMKAILARFGNRAVNLRGAAARLDELRTGEGEPMPPLT